MKIFLIGEALIVALFLYVSEQNFTKEFFVPLGCVSLIWLVICAIGGIINSVFKKQPPLIRESEHDDLIDKHEVLFDMIEDEILR